MDDIDADSLYRQPEDYDFQESIECDLGTCHCEWFNQMDKQCGQEDYILESLRDRSWADPLDNRALAIRSGVKGFYADRAQRREQVYKTRFTIKERKRIRLACQGKLTIGQLEINKVLRFHAILHRHIVEEFWCGLERDYYYGTYDRASGRFLPDGSCPRETGRRTPAADQPAPRYDDVFFEGTEWLNGMAVGDDVDGDDRSVEESVLIDDSIIKPFFVSSEVNSPLPVELLDEHGM